MRKDRLLKLADFLDTVPRKVFTMNWWVSKKATKPEGKKLGECGFAGCAMGWAAHAKLFRGLREEEEMENTIAYRPARAVVYYDFTAAAMLFDIDKDASLALFSQGSYAGIKGVKIDAVGTADPTPKQVAERIRKFVAGAVTPRAVARSD